MRSEEESPSSYLGRFIPLHYHHNMLVDEHRMSAFKTAIDRTVFPGTQVLELGGGTGVLSWFAAAKASNLTEVRNEDLLCDEPYPYGRIRMDCPMA